MNRALVLGIAGALVAAGALTSRDSGADCNHLCPAKDMDAHGCCPAPAPQPKAGADAKPVCTDGRESNPDTAGHCCWAGQVWAAGKCVGAPTSCPKGYVVDKPREQCRLTECPSGMVRPPNDHNECCWPGQAWSKVRNTCVGVPKSCPKTHELSGETCLSLDLDGDGIPNKIDKCPNEAEDFNGFQDADGCPDEPILRARREAAEREAREKREAEERAVREARESAERAEREKREAAERAEREAREAEQKRREEHAARLEEARKKAATARSSDAVGLTIGITGLGISALFMALGATENGKIKGGGLATADDITNAAKTGKTLNIAAAISGGLGGLFVAIAVPMLIVHREPKDEDVAQAPAPRRAWLTVGPGSLGVQGAF